MEGLGGVRGGSRGRLLWTQAWSVAVDFEPLTQSPFFRWVTVVAALPPLVRGGTRGHPRQSHQRTAPPWAPARGTRTM